MAAEATSRGPAFRLSVLSHGTGPTGPASLAVSGLVESAARYQLELKVQKGSTQLVTDALGYDGTTWVRTQGGSWQSAPASAAPQPTSFIDYAKAAQGVTDNGQVLHAGVTCEQFSANAMLPAPSPGGATVPATMTAWISRASGYLVGEMVKTTDATGAVTGTVDIELTDFGTVERVPSRPPA